MNLTNKFPLFCFVTFLLILPKITYSQNLEEVASLPVVLKGSSGIAITETGNLWTINDHGKPFLYQIDRNTGEVLRAIYLNNKVNDWEDLTVDKSGNFYIGDFGNNSNNRKDLKIYKISNPDSITNKVTTAKIIHFSLSDQNEFPPSQYDKEYDIESMVHFNGKLYLFSKSRGKPFKGKVKMYMLDDEPGDHIAMLEDSLFTGEGSMYENWITGATLINDNMLALLSHNKIFFLSCFTENSFFNGKLTSWELNHFSQKEAICHDKESDKLIITDELTQGILGGKMYSLEIPKILSNCIKKSQKH